MPVRKLEVGKRYINRMGEVIEIVARCVLTTHPYEGSDGEYYRHNGRKGFFKDNKFDLIEETTKEINKVPAEWSKFVAEMLSGAYNKAA